MVSQFGTNEDVSAVSTGSQTMLIVNGIFCGVGDSKTPLIFVGIACVVNIIADYTLIDIFKMGAEGAAIATISAQAVSVILSAFIIKKKLPFKIGKENFKFNTKLGLGITRLGFPIALLRMSNEVSYLIIIGLVNKSDFLCFILPRRCTLTFIYK